MSPNDLTCPARDGFLTKNRTADRFVTSGAHVSQVVWPINRVCKMCDLSAYAGQVVWPPVSFTLFDPLSRNMEQFQSLQDML
jgi:hypothetical protein